METYRIEVDNWYYDDLAFWAEEDYQDIIDKVILKVEADFGRRVINYYLSPELMLIKVWIGLFK